MPASKDELAADPLGLDVTVSARRQRYHSDEGSIFGRDYRKTGNTGNADDSLVKALSVVENPTPEAMARGNPAVWLWCYATNGLRLYRPRLPDTTTRCQCSRMPT